ncbi:MAG TPA: RsmE family RNA methyltransferase [Sediminibacterium sp.]|nr:RsmE family RNA methyltransferase [Sediminibacterium sp.]
MDIPFFFEADLPANPAHFPLSPETSKHCIQVLRMQPGEPIVLTNGAGLKYDAVILSADKKQTVVTLSNPVFLPRPEPFTTIAISFVKNPARMEWFLEKATEIGVSAVYPLITSRTEKKHFKAERWEHIVISAMLQSRQVWKMQLHLPVDFHQLIQQKTEGLALIAHCEDGVKHSIASMEHAANRMILIGPEGDFSPEEIAAALRQGFRPVSLGNTRLRTETAGITAAVLLQNL